MLAIPGITVSHVHVWAEVYLQTMNRPRWWRSYGNLAEDTGLARVTVIRATTWLKNQGLVSVERRKDEAGDDAPNILRVHFPPVSGVGDETTPSRLHDTAWGRSDDTTGGHTRETQRETVRTKTRERNTSSSPANRFDDYEDEEIVELVEETAWKRGFELCLEFHHNAREAAVSMVRDGKTVAFASNTAIKSTSACPHGRAAGTTLSRSPRPAVHDELRLGEQNVLSPSGVERRAEVAAQWDRFVG